ncbi:hypothetical protein LXL04_038988 [Taraxacum kok-saghyz]
MTITTGGRRGTRYGIAMKVPEEGKSEVVRRGPFPAVVHRGPFPVVDPLRKSTAQINPKSFTGIQGISGDLKKESNGIGRKMIPIPSNIDRYPILHGIVYESDTMSISRIRMSRTSFKKLCHMLETFGGLKQSRNMDIDKQVAMFLHILAHNVKNRVIISRFRRSGETISRHFSRFTYAFFVINYKVYFCIMACCLLHNFIRQEMEVDPFDNNDHEEGTGDVGHEEVDSITSIGILNEWTIFRDNLAESLFASTGALN